MFQRFDGRKVRGNPARVFELMEGTPITYDMLRKHMFEQLASFTGEPVKTLQARFGTQSLRIGGATLAAVGVPDRMFQRHGGWRSAAMRDHYVQDTLDARLGVTRAMGY